MKNVAASELKYKHERKEVDLKTETHCKQLRVGNCTSAVKTNQSSVYLMIHSNLIFED
jgi:hypothetical protein